ncbi:PREDICTED: HMG-Y-related protein B [Ipomoea nil]|uniref:HMG-Y-related protein B n=1 Tax=Ipomoea nil TaxID=35883 RepID=UPI0009010FCF|nr:PREDICTED: HMG-Y-related protein B [Ipomoea nil]
MATVEDQPANSSLPQYPELIMAAIEELNEKGGSTKSDISRQIEAAHGGELPGSHATLLTHYLDKMKQSGQLVLVKNNYMKPDPNAPPRRGRGRPPKPKAPLPPGYVPPPPRPRGRPPKPRDPFAPVVSPMKKASAGGGSGRKRGRPPKSSTPAAAPPPASGPPRGRGRPPKVNPAVAAPVGA